MMFVMQKYIAEDSTYSKWEGSLKREEASDSFQTHVVEHQIVARFNHGLVTSKFQYGELALSHYQWLIDNYLGLEYVAWYKVLADGSRSLGGEYMTDLAENSTDKG